MLCYRDRRAAMELGIALPSWMVEKKGRYLVGCTDSNSYRQMIPQLVGAYASLFVGLVVGVVGR